ncbi:hypothetical protein HY213_05365 [Candidatus Peregrinibacteria bacterium]|nr:hypothetical protein [Candidatus Peregrinibacteria bacterium]
MMHLRMTALLQRIETADRSLLESIAMKFVRARKKFKRTHGIRSEFEMEQIMNALEERDQQLNNVEVASNNSLTAADVTSEHLKGMQYLQQGKVNGVLRRTQSAAPEVLPPSIESIAHAAIASADTAQKLEMLLEVLDQHPELWSDAQTKRSVEDAISERAPFLWDVLLSVPTGVDRENLARTLTEERQHIESSRDRVMALLVEFIGEKGIGVKTWGDIERTVGPGALQKHPAAVLNYLHQILERKGVTLTDQQLAALRLAAAGVSGHRIRYSAHRPSVQAIYQIEAGGEGGEPLPINTELTKAQKRELIGNFKLITNFTLRKIINDTRPLIDAGVSFQDRRIQKKIESICNQLGQERWWWARDVPVALTTTYREMLDELGATFVEEVKERLLNADAAAQRPQRKAIYKRLFGEYPLTNLGDDRLLQPPLSGEAA